PIKKPEKPAANPSSYRPISLTSCLCKTMEKMVTERLTYHLESNKYLTKAQTGFRKNKSTIDQIIKLQDHITKYNGTKGFTVATFLDFEKAFDMAYKNGLLSKIKKLNISQNMFNFIKSFLSERTFQVKIGEITSNVKCMEN